MKALAFIFMLAFPPAFASADGLGFKFSGENVSLAATTTSSVATFGTAAAINAPQVIVYNAAAAPAVVNCGPTSSVVAVVPTSGTNGGELIPPGVSYEVFKGNTGFCAAVLTTGTGTVYFSPGIFQ